MTTYTVKQTEKGIFFKEGRKTRATIKLADPKYSTCLKDGHYIPAYYTAVFSSGVWGNFGENEFQKCVSGVIDIIGITPFSGEVEFIGLENIHPF